MKTLIHCHREKLDVVFIRQHNLHTSFQTLFFVPFSIEFTLATFFAFQTVNLKFSFFVSVTKQFTARNWNKFRYLSFHSTFRHGSSQYFPNILFRGKIMQILFHSFLAQMNTSFTHLFNLKILFIEPTKHQLEISFERNPFLFNPCSTHEKPVELMSCWT